MKAVISIGKLAEQCGIETFRCGSSWGGTWGYTEKGSNSRTNGFKTKKLALTHWFEECLEGKLGEVLLNKYLEVRP